VVALGARLDIGLDLETPLLVVATGEGRMTPVGKWNHAIGVLGVPGCGKSTYAAALAMELGQEPAYLLAHDPTWRIPATLPDGRSVPLRRHATLDMCRAEMKTDARGLHAPTVRDGAEILAFASAVAQVSKGGELVPLGKPAVPVVVLVDECAALEHSGPGRLRNELLELLIGRRHKHVALIYTVQSPRLVDVSLLSLATQLVLFRIIDEKSRYRLRDEAGVPEPIVEQLQNLPDHQYLVHVLQKHE